MSGGRSKNGLRNFWWFVGFNKHPNTDARTCSVGPALLGVMWLWYPSSASIAGALKLVLAQQWFRYLLYGP